MKGAIPPKVPKFTSALILIITLRAYSNTLLNGLI